MDEGEMSRLLTESARAIQESCGEPETLRSAVDQAVTMIAGCTSAGIFARDTDESIRTAAATDAVVHRIDELQLALDEGPCLDALRSGGVLSSSDLRAEQRWPRWGPAAYAASSVLSVLSVPLFDQPQGHWALNMYSTQPNAFDHSDRMAAVALAAQVAILVAAERRDQELQGAAERRTVIGQAQGILMERFGLTAQQSFATLVRVSQTSNTRLYVIAQRLAESKTTPPELNGSNPPRRQ